MSALKFAIVAATGGLVVGLSALGWFLAVPAYRQADEFADVAPLASAYSALQEMGVDVKATPSKPLAGSVRLQFSALADSLVNGHALLRTRRTAWDLDEAVLQGVLIPSAGVSARAEIKCKFDAPDYLMTVHYVQALPGQSAVPSPEAKASGYGYPGAPGQLARVVDAQASRAGAFVDDAVPLYAWLPSHYQVLVVPDAMSKSVSRIPVWQGGCPTARLSAEQFQQGVSAFDVQGRLRTALWSSSVVKPQDIPVAGGEAWGIENGKVALSQPGIGSAGLTWSFADGDKAATFYQGLMGNLMRTTGAPSHKVWSHVDGKSVTAQAEWETADGAQIAASLRAPADKWLLNLKWTLPPTNGGKGSEVPKQNPFGSPGPASSRAP